MCQNGLYRQRLVWLPKENQLLALYMTWLTFSPLILDSHIDSNGFAGWTFKHRLYSSPEVNVKGSSLWVFDTVTPTHRKMFVFGLFRCFDLCSDSEVWRTVLWGVQALARTGRAWTPGKYQFTAKMFWQTCHSCRKCQRPERNWILLCEVLSWCVVGSVARFLPIGTFLLHYQSHRIHRIPFNQDTNY